MRTLEELKNFYTQNLVPKLQVLEKQRIEVANKLMIVFAAILVPAVLISFLVKDLWPLFIGIALLIFIVLPSADSFEDTLLPWNPPGSLDQVLRLAIQGPDLSKSRANRPGRKPPLFSSSDLAVVPSSLSAF